MKRFIRAGVIGAALGATALPAWAQPPAPTEITTLRCAAQSAPCDEVILQALARLNALGLSGPPQTQALAALGIEAVEQARATPHMAPDMAAVLRRLGRAAGDPGQAETLARVAGDVFNGRASAQSAVDLAATAR